MSAIHVKTNEIRFPVAPNLYGLFFEDINRSGDGGLYPEMLRNRTFEDSILPERCTLLANGLDFATPRGWKDQFNNGEGLRRWITDLEPTEIRYVWSLDNHEGYIDAITRSRYSFRGPHKYLPELEYGCWMKVRIEAEHDCIRCYINGTLVQEQPNVHYPTVSATAAVTGDDIIIKVANLGEAEDPIEICLDCDVAADYEVTLLTGDGPKLKNDFEHPLAVSPVTKTGHGAAKSFVYHAPAYSLNILKLRRK